MILYANHVLAKLLKLG